MQNIFAPFAAKEAFQLQDDGAVLPALQADYPLDVQEWVLTTDTMISDVHLPRETAMSIIAKRLLLVNLSDIAAMGALPVYVTFNLGLQPDCVSAQIADFSQGFQEIASEYQLEILGGDTVRLAANQQGWMVSATLIGKRSLTERKLRSQAQIGDFLAVTGSLGDAMLGLALVEKPNLANKLAIDDCDFLRMRYYLPTPRFAKNVQVRSYINGLMDVSDGVVCDAARFAKASGLGLQLAVEKIPMSDAAANFLAQYPDYREQWRNGGDDYELLLSVAAKDFALLQDAFKPLSVTQIGVFHAQKDGISLTHNGKNYQPSGFQHFSGNGL